VGRVGTEGISRWSWSLYTRKTRFVANSVTLETETILQDALNEYGGNLIRFDISTARAIGSKNLWQPAYPITQWSIEK